MLQIVRLVTKCELASQIGVPLDFSFLKKDRFFVFFIKNKKSVFFREQRVRSNFLGWKVSFLLFFKAQSFGVILVALVLCKIFDFAPKLEFLMSCSLLSIDCFLLIFESTH
jgi:hypothetical protein